MFYVISVALEDTESQKHGFVFLIDLRDLPSQSREIVEWDRKLAKLFFSMLRDCLPARMTAMHSCLPSRKLQVAIDDLDALYFLDAGKASKDT